MPRFVIFGGKWANYFSAFGVVNISFLPHFISPAMRFMNSVIPLAAYSIFYSLSHRSLASPLSAQTAPLAFPGLIWLCWRKKESNISLTLLMQF